MIRLRGYILTLLNIRFMQRFTQPSIADTWVVTCSSFIECFAGSCVTVMLNFDNFSGHVQLYLGAR